MGKDGSVSRPVALPAWLSLVAWAAGLAAMGSALRAASPLGIRPALVVAEIFLAAPALVALALWRIPWGRGLALHRLSPRVSLLAVLTGAALWAASLGLFEVQYSFWPPPAGYLDSFQVLHRALRPSGLLDGALSVVAIGVAPAVCEEIVFRGTLLPSFVRIARTWGAILLSALLFGIIHVDPTTSGAYTLYRVPFATAVGLGLGILRARSGSLLPCAVAHAVLNTITFLAVLVTDPPIGAPEPPDVLQGAALLVLGGAASFWLLRARSTANRPVPESSSC
jgi:membrane protease YdiL (CAAX protease family)